jgi:hypothetical protein
VRRRHQELKGLSLDFTKNCVFSEPVDVYPTHLNLTIAAYLLFSTICRWPHQYSPYFYGPSVWPRSQLHVPGFYSDLNIEDMHTFGSLFRIRPKRCSSTSEQGPHRFAHDHQRATDRADRAPPRFARSYSPMDQLIRCSHRQSISPCSALPWAAREQPLERHYCSAATLPLRLPSVRCSSRSPSPSTYASGKRCAA